MFDFFEETYDSVMGSSESGSETPGAAPEAAAAETSGDDGFLESAGQWLGDWGSGIDQEGLSAVFDPFGAVDRQEAQRELADRFQVVEDTEGREAENQVTQEQFQEIARTYSNIRMGRSDIEFNTEGLEDEQAEAFQAGMMNDLASIMQTEGGRTLVNRLSNNENDHTTTLSPLFHKNDEGDYDPSLGRDNSNGYARADNIRDAYRIDEDTAGAGTDSRVRLNPGQELGPDVDPEQDRWLPWRSDVLLYHELVHSMDHTYGTMDRSSAGTDADGVRNSEGEPYNTPWDSGVRRREHRATGLGNYADEAISENAYRAARRDIGATDYGERAGDDDMADRDTYNQHQHNWREIYGEPDREGWERDPHHH